MTSAIESVIRRAVTKGVIALANFNRDRQDPDELHPFLNGIHAPHARRADPAQP